MSISSAKCPKITYKMSTTRRVYEQTHPTDNLLQRFQKDFSHFSRKFLVGYQSVRLRAPKLRCCLSDISAVQTWHSHNLFREKTIMGLRKLLTMVPWVSKVEEDQRKLVLNEKMTWSKMRSRRIIIKKSGNLRLLPGYVAT